MSVLPKAVQRYLDKSAIKGSWQLTGSARTALTAAVVIPALAEGESLVATLQSLAGIPTDDWQNTLVVVVVNHSDEATSEVIAQNRADLVRLAAIAKTTEVPLAWVDAASPGREFPVHRAGVGFARKLGMDLVLSRLDWQAEPLLVYLDADTLVEPNYLQAIRHHYRQAEAGAAVLPFQHQPAADAASQSAIDRYELFLRSYVLGLKLAGSPYAFNAVGSAMSCRAMAYVRCGGMNLRKAGEDFYFLQKLAKTDGVARLNGTMVFPSPRISGRVPFGTGRSMGLLLQGETEAVQYYPLAPFLILADWLRCVEQNAVATAEFLLARAEEISPVLAEYLVQSTWLTTWPRLQLNYRTNAERVRAFHIWFDGFKTLRLIHLLCDSGFARGDAAERLPAFFAKAGLSCPGTISEMLAVLRHNDEIR